MLERLPAPEAPARPAGRRAVGRRAADCWRSPAASAPGRKLILLDEPTEGIQPSIIEEIAETLQRLAATGLTIILVEQNLEFIASLSSRVLVIQKGRITGELGPTAPKTPASSPKSPAWRLTPPTAA